MATEKFLVGQYISRLARMNNRWLEPRLNELGLSPAQLPVFGAIKVHGSLSQKELVALLHVEQSSMAQLLTRMEKSGLVAREADPNDGRSARIHLTKRAQQLSGPAHLVLDEGQKILQMRLTKQELLTLENLLAKLLENMGQALQGKGSEEW
jgi:MarR family transcriptional regulator for hemolysin